MIEIIQKSNHIVTNHVVNGQSKNTTFGLHGNGFFNGGLTTIRRKRTRKVPYNQIEGGLAHCTVFDKNNNQLILDESVLNGGVYKLFRFGEHVFLEPESNPNILQPDPTTIPQTSLPIKLRTTVPKTPLPTFTRPESIRRSTRRLVTTTSVKTTTKPKDLERNYYRIPLDTAYDCNIFGYCKYKKTYFKLLQDVQGN